MANSSSSHLYELEKWSYFEETVFLQEMNGGIIFDQIPYFPN